MSLIPSNLAKEIKSKFSSIRKDMYRTVILYGEENKNDCPNCFIQGPEGYSTNEFDSSFVTSFS